jgi:predicted DNA-binding transcriptional regulator YafY
VIAARLPPGVGFIEPIDEHSSMFEMGASTFESLATHLVLLGADFEVSTPAELVEEVRRLMDRLRRATS